MITIKYFLYIYIYELKLNNVHFKLYKSIIFFSFNLQGLPGIPGGPGSDGKPGPPVCTLCKYFIPVLLPTQPYPHPIHMTGCYHSQVNWLLSVCFKCQSTFCAVSL